MGNPQTDVGLGQWRSDEGEWTEPNQAERKGPLQPAESLPPLLVLPVIILVQFPLPRLKISQRKWC